MPRTKITDIEHLEDPEWVRLRPNVFLGPTICNPRMEMVWVPEGDSGFFQMKKISNCIAERQTFREIVSNACDATRTAMLDRVDPGTVIFEFDTGEKGEIPIITVSNGGHPIPIEIHPKFGIWGPQLTFGVFKSSKNYNDQGEENVGGLNGIGAKGCNLFSSFFEVTVRDKENSKIWFQRFEKFVPGEPKIKENIKVKENLIRVRYQHDGTFGIPRIDWYCLDVISAAVASVAHVQLRINDNFFDFQNLKLQDWLKFYPAVEADSENEGELEEKMRNLTTNDDGSSKKRKYKKTRTVKVNYQGPNQPKLIVSWKDRFGNEVIVADINETFDFPRVQGWVNGIPCSKGVHVDTAKDVFARAFEKLLMTHRESAEKLEKYRPKSFPALIKNNVLFLVKIETKERPNFGAGQIKDMLEGPKIDLSMFDSEDKDNPMGKIEPVWSNWKETHLMEVINAFWRGEAEKELKKTDGIKAKHVSMSCYIGANFAGTKNSSKANLIGVEGKSASTYPKWWIAEYGQTGQDFNGIFMFRGKLINAMNASLEDLGDNEEIKSLKKALGLQEGLDYAEETNFATLRYGKFIILVDSDDDGLHIKGLILNYFYSRFPSLLRRGFVTCTLSCAVRVLHDRETYRFYKWESYLKWIEENPGRAKWKTYYFKGLGSSTRSDVQDDFKNPRSITYELGEDHEDIMHLAFDDRCSNDRKTWIEESEIVRDDLLDETQSLRRYAESDLLIFFWRSIIRAIPALEDGFKDVHRKLVYGGFNQKEFTPIDSLASKVKAEMNYHHGDSINSALTKMTQDFAGSNNLPLFEGKGAMGSRIRGGKDASSARYVKARISPVARKIFPEQDFPLLKLREEEGKKIEPDYLLPIVPISLINGADGIACGWSTFLPSFDPKAVIDNLRRLLTGKSFREMIPWYQNYGGTIEVSPDGFYSNGILTRRGRDWKISELPLFDWTLAFRRKLEVLIEEKKIKDFRENGDPETINFTVNGPTEELLGFKRNEAADEAQLHARAFEFFGLQSHHSMKNMVLLKNGFPKKYEKIEEIIKDFIDFRLPFYEKRRKYLIKELERNIEHSRQHLSLLKLLAEKKLDLSDDKLIEKAIELDSSLTEVIIDEILDKQPLRNVRKEGLSKLEKKLEILSKELVIMENSKADGLWLDDLQALEKAI